MQGSVRSIENVVFIYTYIACAGTERLTLLRKVKNKGFIYEVNKVPGVHAVILYKVTLAFLLSKLQYFIVNYESMTSQTGGGDGFLGLE